MTAILVEPRMTDAARREALYRGDLVVFAPRESSTALCNLAWEMIQDAFGSIDPQVAQFELSVERFVDVIAELKPKFTHHPRAKQHMREMFEELNADPNETYFDVPRMRVVTSDEYLTTGMGYAYSSHRDTWYACPPSQINWWSPITSISEQCGLMFHPTFFNTPVRNTSEDFDAYQWNADGRKNAAQHIGTDPRPHPKLREPINLDRQVIVGEPGSVILFSGQHLHATIPNTSGRTRFSLDFRTVNADDVIGHRGATTVDSDATSTTLRDFMRSTDQQRFAESVIETYETGERPTDGVLVFDPNAGLAS